VSTSTRSDGPLGPLTDEQLSHRATNGDQEAFLELFSRHERGLLNFCHRLTGNREDAADLVQESFLRVFARLGALEGREVNLAAYLRRTARNLAYDGAAGRGREVAVDDLELVAGADTALETDPERAMLLSDQQDAVQRANAALPERHRLALALRELEDMDYAQIGEVLEVTPDAVAQLLVRARLGLRRQLRIASVDEERMAPACRARLADIGSLIDGQLDQDRAYVLRQHLSTCATCAQVRSSFEDARIRYRAWLPIPVLLGLGAETLRAASARGLLEGFTDSGSWDDGGAAGAGGDVGGAAGGGTRALSHAAAGGAATGAAGGAATGAAGAADGLWTSWSSRRRAAALVGAAAALLVIGGGSAVFALRGADEPARDIAALPDPVTPAPAGSVAAPPPAAQELPKPPLPGTTTGGGAVTTTAGAPAAPADPASAGPAPQTEPRAPRPPRAPGGAPGTSTAVAPAVPVAGTPTQPSDPQPPAVTIATPPATIAPPSTTVRQPPPVTTVRQPPPVTTVRQPPPVTTVREPPPTTTQRVPVDPPPTTTTRTPDPPRTITTTRTTIRIPPIVTTIRIPTIRIPPTTTQEPPR